MNQSEETQYRHSSSLARWPCLSAAIATPVLAQPVISEPGYCAFF
jgi:hypothetical protein